MITSRFEGTGVPACYRDPVWLRATGAVPHYFGLGFIQLKLESERSPVFGTDIRMHFWVPALSPITEAEEVHNHRYDFFSTVVAGSLVHETWQFESHPSGQTEIVEVSCKPGVPADPEPLGRGTPHLTGRYTLATGSSYFFPHTGFHRTITTQSAVTLLERGPIRSQNALVLRPIGAASVCPFSKTVDTDALWALIAEALS